MNITHAIIGTITLIVAYAYLALVCVIIKKKKFDTAKNIKCQIAFSAGICVLYIIRTVGEFLLEQPIFYSCCIGICALLYGVTAVLYLKILKKDFNTNTSKEDEKTEKDNNEEDK